MAAPRGEQRVDALEVDVVAAPDLRDRLGPMALPVDAEERARGAGPVRRAAPDAVVLGVDRDELPADDVVLVISMGDRKLGLIVGSLEGEEELVIKALDDQTVATDLISGASILGDGRVVLIVNLPAIVERHSKHRPQEAEGVVSGILLSHADRNIPSEGPAEVRP